MKNKQTFTVQTIKANSNKGLSFLSGINRAVVPSHVTRLAKSLETMGILRPVVTTTIDFLDGKPVQYIVDGQHLYTVLLRLGWDIPYVEIDVANTKELVEYIALLNASSKTWTLMNYVDAWKQINKDYIKLIKYFNIYDIELTQLAQILDRGVCVNNNAYTKILKSGSFTINNEDAAIALLDKITELLNIVPRMDRVSNKLLIQSYCVYATHPDYNHTKTMTYIKKNVDIFKLATQDPEEYTKLFKQIQ